MNAIRPSKTQRSPHLRVSLSERIALAIILVALVFVAYGICFSRWGYWPYFGTQYRYREEAYQETRREADRIIKALEAFKIRTGRYPDALESLIPNELSVIVNPTVGYGRWDYRRYPADQNGPERFVIGFFVGPDYESDTYSSDKPNSTDNAKWHVDR